MIISIAVPYGMARETPPARASGPDARVSKITSERPGRAPGPCVRAGCTASAHRA